MRCHSAYYVTACLATLTACASISGLPGLRRVTPPFWTAVDQGVVVVVMPDPPGAWTDAEGADDFTAFFYEGNLNVLSRELARLDADLAPHAARLVEALSEHGAAVTLGDPDTPADSEEGPRYRLEIGVAYRGLTRKFAGPVPLGPKKVVAQVFVLLTERGNEKPLFAQAATRAEHFDASGAAADEAPRMERAFATAVDEAAKMVIGRFLRWRGTRVSHHEVAGIDAI